MDNSMSKNIDPGLGFSDRVAQAGPRLAPAAIRVVNFIDANRALALASSAVELAGHAETSDATVVRTVQALGYCGLGELKQALAREFELDTPADNMRRTLKEVGPDTAQAIGTVLDTHAEATQALRTRTMRARIEAAVAVLRPAERIAVFGIGPSAPIAGYVAGMLRRAGRRSAALDVSGIMLADRLLELRAGDAILILAYGEPYPEVKAVFGEANRLQLPTVLVTDTPASALARMADAVLPGMRGRAGRVALHGTTLVALEALVLGLTVAASPVAIATLERLNRLRDAIAGKRG
jgi:DNA-binding MurR/RpiR family transcriptional regulator